MRFSGAEETGNRLGKALNNNRGITKILRNTQKPHGN